MSLPRLTCQLKSLCLLGFEWFSLTEQDIEDIKKYSAKAIAHQSGSIDKSLMRGKNYEIFTIPHYATGIHITEKGMDFRPPFAAASQYIFSVSNGRR